MSMNEMKQTVLVGLGGTGSRVVNNVARMLRERHIPINDGKVTCVVLDTNQSDNALIQNSGTDIPVIPTCDERTIDQYLARYPNKRVGEWCPYSPSFGRTSMIAGASEVRVKSRLAFMDTMESGAIRQLQKEVEKVFHNRPGKAEQIRVMVVSSLSGGTGSGMFIQVALWLRQFFEKKGCLATIRGILLLPDIFISTVPNIQDNPRKPLYHYANAYAAIRELNAINKVVKTQMPLAKPMIIDDLFDSRKPPKAPVFDNAFFIDDTAEGGAAFTELETYEEVVAQMVYMQLYAPMQNEMISVEDNLYRSFEANPEPAYGSCGTARAEYPVDDVVDYCSIRAAQDAVAQGWTGLDQEIADMRVQFDVDRRDGINLDREFDARAEYVRLFRERSNKAGDEIGFGDRLFVALKNEVLNQSRDTSNKDNPVVSSCKVEDYMDLIRDIVAERIREMSEFRAVTRVCGSLPNPDEPDKFPKELLETLKGLRTTEEKAVAKVLGQFDEKSDEMARAIVRELVPLDVSSVSAASHRSIYSLFHKEDMNGNKSTVHPISARYLLYRLAQAIEEERSSLSTADTLRNRAMKGDQSISFDNDKTRRTESRENYWSDCGWIVSKAEMAHFIKRYKEYNIKNEALCRQYGQDVLMQLVLKGLADLVQGLIREMESLFAEFKDLQLQMEQDLGKNVRKNEVSISNIMYVYAKAEHKEAVYRSLHLDPLGENSALNESIVRTVYGKFCAGKRPNVEANQSYAEGSVINQIYQALKDGYRTAIRSDYRDKVDLSVISAIQAESDFAYAAEQARRKAAGDKVSLEDKFSDETESHRRAVRHELAITHYKNQLLLKAAPFLQAQPDESLSDLSRVDRINRDANGEIWMTTEDNNVLYMPFQTRLTFWGYNPSLTAEYGNLSAILGAHDATSAHVGYRSNELCCYQSIYGVIAEKIAKFNEQQGGDYYTNYTAVIHSMIKNGSEIVTPHLDKHWHEFLPYISATREAEAQRRFGLAFWRALAYGRVSVDRKGKYQISKAKTDAYGGVSYVNEPLLCEGKPIEKTDIHRLITVLRSHPDFNAQITAELEAQYEKDVSGMTNYVDTKMYNALLSSEDGNPFTVLTRYQQSRHYAVDVKSELLSALEFIMADLVDHLDVNRGEQAAATAKWKLIYRLYEACTMTKKALSIEEKGWMEIFLEEKLISQQKAKADQAAAADAANADDEA